VAKVLVTGGTGFIGAELVRELLQRGDEVRVAARSRALPETLEGAEVELVACDILDRKAVKRALRGVERVFHAAGLTSLRQADRARCFEVNVRGTKTVLEECLRADVERVVYTSSASAIGPAPPREAADETQLFTAGRLGIAYVNSKHEAEAEAMRLAAHGLPLVCVNPTFVLGPGDVRGTSAGVVRRFMLGRIPLYVPGGLNVVDVRDVARGHLLADSRGKVGERYILGGRNFTLDRLFADLSRLSDVPPPVKLPAAMVLGSVELAERVGLPAPTSPDEVRAGALWWTYRNTKARRELGFKPRSHEETLGDAVTWQLGELGARVRRDRGPQRVALEMVALAGRTARRAAIGLGLG
jgi:dihydroflavonol-4-reductase